MTSDRKIRANRANAQASTGPKTTPGRARAARNSLRHGLSLPVYSDPVLSKEVEALARKIIESNGNAKNQGLAHRFAEAQIDIRRVRGARHQLLNTALCDPDYVPASHAKKIKLLAKAAKLGAEYPVFAEQHLTPLFKSLEQYVHWRPEGPQKFATILRDMGKQLAVLGRYEKRALSRRNAAVRALDTARRECFMKTGA